MILEKEQIHRYMRHVIMQEIGGVGQKKLLNSSVLVCCESLHHAAFMLYYLTAMGIGKITCMTDDHSDSKQLAENLKKLNPDVSVSIISQDCGNCSYDAVIALNALPDDVKAFTLQKDTPLILAASIGAEAFIMTAANKDEHKTAIQEFTGFSHRKQPKCEEPLLNFPSLCLIGSLAAIETVKAILEIGKCFEKPQFINLEDYSFSNHLEVKPKESPIADDRGLSDQLKDKKVLIVGSGGLGSPVAYILTQMGIGKLGLVDFDIVDISNLNRQILHSTDRLGMPKVESAKAFLNTLNPSIEICTYNERFSAENAEELVKDYDIIVDGLDNLPTRYLLNDVCYFLKKPLIEAGVLSFNGLATAILPDKGPCYRCTFPEVADAGPIPSCSETGVLGAVPGVMGTLQAIEVIKQLTGSANTLLNKILMFDAINAEFTLLDIYKEDSCALCGSNPTIDALKDYNFHCESKKLL